MAKKPEEPKIIIEREYNVPLRKGWLKVPKYKRAAKAVKTLKQFIARHMKIYDRDLRKVKIDMILNNEIRFRGMKKPLSQVKIKAKKFDDGIVRVELLHIPNPLKFKKSKQEKKSAEIKKKVEEIKKEKAGKGDEKSEEDRERKEKVKEESLKVAKEQIKEQKHISKDKGVIVQRKALVK